jgi:hypothetical protein
MWLQGLAGLLILIWLEHEHDWRFRVLSILRVASSLPRPFWLSVTTFAAHRAIHFRLVFTMLMVRAFLMMLRAIKYLCFQLLNATKRKCLNTIFHIVMRPRVTADYVPEASYFLAAFLCNTKSSYNSGYDKGHVFWLLGCCPLKKSLRVPVKCKKNVNLYLKCASQKLEGCLNVHLLHEIMWNANFMQQGNFIDVFLTLHVSGTYVHHQEY